MHYSEAGKISILGTERAVENVDVIDQFRSQSFQCAQVALAVPLGGLILLHVIDQNFQPAVHSAVIEIETEAADLQRLSSAFVLPSVDARRQRIEDLVVAAEQCVFVNTVSLRWSMVGFSALAEITRLSCSSGMV